MLLLVDEVRATSPEMRALADAYQQLVGDGKNIAICMAGLPAAVSSVLNDRVLTFLNRARKIQLQPLALPPIRSYYASTFAEIGLPLDPGVLEHAVAATRGFPYLLQLVGYHLVEESRESSKADEDALERAIADANDDMDDSVFKPTLAGLSRKDIDFCRALASVLDSDGVGRVGDVARALGKENGYVQVYRKRLIEAGVVDSPRDGELEFAVPLLAEKLASAPDAR